MKALRLLAFFLVGLVLGGGSVVAFAAVSDYGRSIRLNAPASAGARFTGAPIYEWADAPGGWGRMNDINKINIGSKSFDVTGGRLFSPRTLAKGAVSFVRYGGPAWLGWMLAGLVWDEVNKRWLKEDEVDVQYPGFRWTVQGCNGPACEPNFATYQEAGHFACTQYYGTQGVTQWTSGGGNPPDMYYTCSPGGSVSRPYQVCPDGQTLQGEVCVDVESGTRPATDQELEDAIYAELVARGMGSDLARRLIAAGYRPTPDGHEVSGPNSVPGDTVTSTTTGPNGTTTVTSSTTHNVSYTTNTTNNTSTVTVSSVTVNTTTGPDGTTESTTETTTPSEGEQEDEPQYTLDYQGSAMPEIPDFYEQQYPDGFAGEWDKFKGKIGASPLAGFLNGLSSGLPGGGTCPDWSVALNFGAMGNFGTHVIAPPCAIWPFIKAVMILSALFVARRMVFGG